MFVSSHVYTIDRQKKEKTITKSFQGNRNLKTIFLKTFAYSF